jgi:thiol-disulfide isomerase/thioredoxin
MTNIRSSNRLPAVACVLVVVALWMAVSAEGQQPSASAPSATLRWRNGDELPGEIVAATNSALTWRTPISSEPLSIEFDYLDSVRAPVTAGAKLPAGPFRFDLVGGHTVYGALAAIDGDRVVVQSPRHGELVIKRSWVTRVVRTENSSVLDLPASRGVGWKSIDRVRKVAVPLTVEWDWSVSGQASTTTMGARLFFAGDVPKVCQIELLVESKGMPRFALAHGSVAEVSDRKGGFEIDTWADELVAQSAARSEDFERLMTLTPMTKSVQLQVIWDRESGNLSVYGADAKLLCEMQAERFVERPGGTAGLFLENKGTDLTVKVLRVAPWEAGQKPQMASGRDAVRTVTGRELRGQISRLDQDGLVRVVAVDGTESSLDVAQIAQISLTPDATSGSATSFCALSLNDGTQVSGQLTAITNGKAFLKTPFSNSDVAVVLDGLRELKLPQAAAGKKQDTSHVLRLGDRQLHGTLAAAGNALGWRPLGSSVVIPLNTTGSLNIKRSDKSQPTIESSKFQDVLHLENGDQAPCTILKIDDSGVHFATDFSDIGRIAPDELKAIEFNAGNTGLVTDFLDSRWRISQQQPNAVERTETQLTFRGPASLSNAEAMKHGGMQLDMTWGPNVQVTLVMQLFTSVNARQRMGSQFQISFSSNRVQIHSISNDGNVQSFMVQAKNTDNGKPKASFTFASERGELKLLVDGTQVCSVPNLERDPGATGISMNVQSPNAGRQQVIQEVADAQGRVVRRVVQVAVPLPANAEPMLTISNFRTSGASSLVQGIRLGEKERVQFLTVPRSRRHNPPQHALAAKNGDVMRGELLTLGPTSAQFRVGMEDVSIPRDRLAGVVWLKLEQEAEKQLVETGTMQAVFRNGSSLRVAIDHVENGKAVGTHPVLGTCRLALDEINELRTGAPPRPALVVAHADWTLINAKEPVIPGGDSSGDAFGTFSPLVGKQADDFTLEMLNGKKFRLSEHKDKVVVLDFWATWCVPCVRAFPQLVAATSKYPEDVLFIAVNQQENASTIREFLKAQDLKAEVALDREGEIGRLYQVDGIPQTVVIGRGGKIEKVALGVSPNLEAELDHALSELVAPKEAAEKRAGDP